MSRSKMLTSTSHEHGSRMSSFAGWSTAARSATFWALLVLVLNAAARRKTPQPQVLRAARRLFKLPAVSLIALRASA